MNDSTSAAPRSKPVSLYHHSADEIAALHKRFLTPNYRNAPIVFCHGAGAWGETEDGSRYLDFSAGVAVNALGHNHPDLVHALRDQVGRLIHQSNYWHNCHAAPLAEQLCGAFEAACAAIEPVSARAFFCNSGAEANEALVKLSRRYHARVIGTARPGFVTAHDSFHGRTFAAMSATAQAKYQDGFGPLVPGFSHADFGDLASFERAIDAAEGGPFPVGAVLIEVVQGEGGVKLAPTGFFKGLRALCDARGILLLLDEVQTGLGRTGTFFAFEQEGIAPDAIALAKALGGGVPVGAIVARDNVAEALQPGTHATTFGANALAMRAGRTVLAVFERDGLVAHTAKLGAYLLDKLHAAFDDRPYTRDVRGRGLMVGVEVSERARDVIIEARDRHNLLVSVAGGTTLRMTPPLIVTEADCDRAVSALRTAADSVLDRQSSDT
jgi:acetylornithine/N-succinyldiaminopimelate aminotransferase